MGNQEGNRGNRPNRALSITVHLEKGQDDDLIKTLNAVPKGHRATVVKKALRGVTSGTGAAAFAMPQQMVMPMMPEIPDHSEALNLLAEKMAWMENALIDLPGYVEGLILRVASTRPKRAALPTPPPPEPERERVSNEVLDQRSTRMKGSAW